jgi:hypothetical protein
MQENLKICIFVEREISLRIPKYSNKAFVNESLARISLKNITGAKLSK